MLATAARASFPLEIHMERTEKTHQPFRQCSLNTVGSDKGGQRIILGGWNQATGGITAQPTSTAQGDVYGFAAGVKAADRLVSNAILANCRRATGIGTPCQAVGRS